MDSLDPKYQQLLEDMNEGLNDAFTRLDKLDAKTKTTTLLVAGVGALCLVEGAGIFFAMKAIQNLAKGLETVGQFAQAHAQATGFTPNATQQQPPRHAAPPQGPRQTMQPRVSTEPVAETDDMFAPPAEETRTVRQTFTARNGSDGTEVPTGPVGEPAEGPSSSVPDWAAQTMASEHVDAKGDDGLS